MAHWYTQDGSTKYTIIGANGKERDTNIADARKLKLLYSVTEVIQKTDKPALTQWRLAKLLEAVKKAPPWATGDTWETIVWDLYKKETEKYSKQGSIVHDKLEDYFKTGNLNPEDEDILLPAIELVESLGYTKYTAESSFACKLGYGGKIDLILGDNDVIIDFKTKEGSQEKFDKLKPFDDWPMQLSAYQEAINKGAKCMNIIVSHDHIGALRVIEWKQEELDRAFAMFKHLLEYTKLVNNYDSSF